MTGLALQHADWPARGDWSRQLAQTGALCLHGVPCEPDNHALRELGRDLGTPSLRALSHRTGLVEAGGVQCVRDVASAPRDQFGKPLLSAAHARFPLHTDEAFLEEPARWVLLQCWQADPGGEGVTQLAARDVIVAAADTATLRALTELRLRYACGDYPVLDAQHRLRYSRHEIRSDDIAHGAATTQAWMDQFDALFERVAETCALGRGDVIILDNTRVLHGRSAFAPGSTRLLKRLRICAD